MSSTDIQNSGFHFTGTLSSTATITFPTFYGLAAIRNNTAGGFSITCGNLGGASVTVLNGETVAVWSDGTDFTRLAESGGGAGNAIIKSSLSPPLTLYVRKTGSDSNNGLTSGSPFLTIAKALTTCASYHANGGNLIVDLGAGTWDEDIFVNGLHTGALSFRAIPSFTTSDTSMLLLRGVGPTTIIAGTGNFLATICASNNAVIGVSNLQVTSNKTSGQCSLFTQMQGGINGFSGVTFGPSQGDDMHSENSAFGIQIWGNWAKTGNASNHMDAGNLGNIIVSTGSASFSGSPAFTNLIAIGPGGCVQFNQGNPFNGQTCSGSRFNIIGGSLNTDGTFPASDLPGNSAGILRAGGRFIGDDSPSVTATVGLGSGGSASFVAGSSAINGQIKMIAGSGASSTGQITVEFQTAPLALNEADSFYIACPALGADGANWAVGAFVSPGEFFGGPPRLTFYWANGAAALDPGTYTFNYAVNPN